MFAAQPLDTVLASRRDDWPVVMTSKSPLRATLRSFVGQPPTIQ